MHVGRALLLMTGLAGCAQPPTELQGVVQDGLDGAGLPGVTVRSLDGAFQEYDTTTTDAFGWYRVDAEAGSIVHIELSGSGILTSGFSGQSGLNPRLRVPTGSSIAFTEEAWEEQLALWEGCPGLGEGGTILGSAQIADVAEENGDIIPVETGVITVSQPDGSLRAACYLGEDGTYDPDATQTGESTRFMVANVQEGVHELTMTWRPVDNATLDEVYQVWVPAGGLAPRFPLLAEPPIDIDL